MIDLRQLQKDALENKRTKGFNTSDVPMELCCMQSELSELFHAYWKKLPTVGEEIADVMIYCLGLSEMLGVNLEQELLKKMEDFGASLDHSVSNAGIVYFDTTGGDNFTDREKKVLRGVIP